MIPRIIKGPIKSTGNLLRYLPNTISTYTCVPLFCSSISSSHLPLHWPFSSPSTNFSNNSAANDSPITRTTELTRVATLLKGCDYEHWLVVMEPPKGNPLRDEIIDRYIKTLICVLKSEEEAKKSIYSVSTKYYYAFGCKVPEKLTYQIKSLPNVKWVLPDSYLNAQENYYGGEPFIDGTVAPYEEKYHIDWLRDQNGDKDEKQGRSGRRRRRRKKKISM